ncbi:MAG: poly-gamma-glutamate biosynthesis protein PgsC [Vicinamibacterales bacterium]
MIEAAIGIGIAVNLVLTELFGLASAGLVVPGYLALYLNQPGRVAATVMVALVTWALVRYGVEAGVVLYGRRRFGVTVLLGFVVNILFLRLAVLLPPEPADLRAIGFIVPGLIANQALVQGLLPTLVMTTLAAAVVRMALVVAFGGLG